VVAVRATRCTPTRLEKPFSSSGSSTAPAMPGRAAAPQAPTPIRAGPTPRGRCCGSSSSTRVAPIRSVSDLAAGGHHMVAPPATASLQGARTIAFEPEYASICAGWSGVEEGAEGNALESTFMRAPFGALFLSAREAPNHRPMKASSHRTVAFSPLDFVHRRVRHLLEPGRAR
jgi:hypothetical protein